MSELDKWLEDNLPNPSDHPDHWEDNKSSEQDIKRFYVACKGLAIYDFEDDIDNIMLNGLHDAAYGYCDLLSVLLTEDRYFSKLSRIKREVLAWVMRNPVSLKKAHRNSGAKLSNNVRCAALMLGWNGYPKDMAIKLTAMQSVLETHRDQYYRLIKENVPEHHFTFGLSVTRELLSDLLAGIAPISDFEEQLNSRCTQIYRAIKTSPYKELFEETVKQKQRQIEEIKHSKIHDN